MTYKKLFLIKIKALSTHMLLSALVILSFISIVWFVWYPYPLLNIEGGVRLIILLFIIDLSLGPLLTFIVYKPKKKGLFMDLSIIVTVQIAALLYGMNIIFTERPLYIAFNVDRFTLVPAADIDLKNLQNKSLKTKFFEQPKLVYVDAPQDKKTREKRMFAVISGKAKDIAYRPEYYQDIQKFSSTIVDNKFQLSVDDLLKKKPDIAVQLELLEEQNKIKKEQMVFYPIQGKHHDMIIVLNRLTTKVIDILDIPPWSIGMI